MDTHKGKNDMNDKKQHETGGIDIDLVEALASVLREKDLTEIEVEDEQVKIRVTRGGAVVTQVAAPMPMAAAPAPVAHAPAAAADAAPAGPSTANAVRSPMVGTVYLAPEPGAPNFATVGSAVKAGDTILIIEAMKVMNPITAPTAGTLKAVHVENSQPVEFDQPLFTIG